MRILYCLGLCLVVSASGQNDVRLPPSITNDPEKEIIFREFQNITLTCRAEGTPPPTFKWRQNVKISRGQMHQNFPFLGVFVGDLTIKNAKKSDEGFYQCFVTNEYGTALSTVAHVQQAFLQYAWPSYVNITVQEGHPFVIPAARGNSFPSPTYSWENARGVVDSNPNKFMTTQRVRQACNGDLHFAYAEKSDDLNGRIYKSLVFNAVTDQRVGGGYTKVIVTQGSRPVKNFSPNITYFAKSRDVALIGSDIQLKCFSSGKPLPDITWSRPGNNLPFGRHSIPSSDYNTLLNISNITESDEGEYVCTAKNSGGTASHTFHIRVEAVPIFEQLYDGPRDVNVTEGDSITFNCSAFAKPNATAVWLQNGKPINVTNAPTRFLFSNDLKSLTIRDVCRDCVDRENKTGLMVIQCNASNVHGYAFAQGYLNVLRFWSPSHCNACFDKTSTDSHTTTTGAEVDSLSVTVTDEITSPVPELTVGLYTESEGLSPENLSVSITIKSQDISGTTKGWMESGRNITSNEKDIKVDDLTTTAPKNKETVAELTNQLTNESARNINASIMILNQLAYVLKGTNVSANEEQIKSIVQVISNILHSNNSNACKELNDVILSIMDDFGLILAMLSIPGNVTVSTDNLVLEAWSFVNLNRSFQIEFPNGSLWGENRGDRISISMETLSGNNLPTLIMWGVYYRTIHDQLPGNNDTDFVNSRLLSFSIRGLNTNETVKKKVLITLRHNEEKNRSYRRICSFLNSNRSDWDSFGCSVQSTNKTHTICSCDHLTNFAILMSRNPVYDTKLSLISIIGCNISVAALLLTVIIYAVTWKHAKSSQAALLLNLCIALIVAYIIFMAGADKVEFSGYSMVGCHVVAVLMHYFFLVAFFIMLAEGVDMVLYIFFVFHVRRTRETIMLIAAAWVLPMIIVGVSLGVTRLEGYGHDEACWLSSEKGLIWAFIGPVLCIIAINLVILIIILRLISKKKAILAKNSRKREEIRATIWNLSVMCPVLGLGWLFGVFSVFFDHVAFQYVFVIANSMHGLLIFIIYALFHNKKMNETISAVYSQYRKTDSSGSNHMNNSSQEHSTNSTANIRTTRPSLQPKSSDSDEFGTKAEVSTHNSGLKDSLLENKAEIHQETAFDHR